jgi:hypothetical protein
MLVTGTFGLPFLRAQEALLATVSTARVHLATVSLCINHEIPAGTSIYSDMKTASSLQYGGHFVAPDELLEQTLKL